MKLPLRLKKRAEFLAMRAGAKMHSAAMIVESRVRVNSETRGEEPRFGFTVTKKTGNSVVRNRIRRRLREAVRQVCAASAKPGHDYVLVGKQAALRTPFSTIVADVARGLDQTGRNKANPNRTRKGHGSPA